MATTQYHGNADSLYHVLLGMHGIERLLPPPKTGTLFASFRFHLLQPPFFRFSLLNLFFSLPFSINSRYCVMKSGSEDHLFLNSFGLGSIMDECVLVRLWSLNACSTILLPSLKS